MLNFNNISKTDKDIILSYNKGYRAMFKAISNDNDIEFNDLVDSVDLSIDSNMLLRYAALKGRKRMLRVMLGKTNVTDRASILCAILSGEQLELIELMGDIDKEKDLSAESLAIAACKGQSDFFIKYFDSVDSKEKSEYDYMVLAARNGQKDIVDFLISNDYEYDIYNVMIAVAGSGSLDILKEITISFKGDFGNDTLLDACIIAATYANNDVLSFILGSIDSSFIDDKNNAIFKAAINSENKDTVEILVKNGAEIGFDNGVAIAIAAHQNGNGDMKGGNVDIFKYINSLYDFDDKSISMAKKIASAYNMKDTLEFIEEELE